MLYKALKINPFKYRFSAGDTLVLTGPRRTAGVKPGALKGAPPVLNGGMRKRAGVDRALSLPNGNVVCPHPAVRPQDSASGGT